MKNTSFGLVVILAVLGIGVHLYSLMHGLRTSQDLVKNYQRVNDHFSTPADSLTQILILNGKVHDQMKARLISLIDSMKQLYQTPADISKKQIEVNANHLLECIMNYNYAQKTIVYSTSQDTIRYETIVDKNGKRQWPPAIFQNVPTTVSITYLNFLRNQLVR